MRKGFDEGIANEDIGCLDLGIEKMGRVSETQRLASSDEVVSNVGVWVEVLDDDLSLDLVDLRG